MRGGKSIWSPEDGEKRKKKTGSERPDKLSDGAVCKMTAVCGHERRLGARTSNYLGMSKPCV
jgi:hypothetical protein